MSLSQQTLTNLRSLKMPGMARSYEVQLSQPKLHEMSFDSRFAMLVDSELSSRETRRIKRLILSAGFPMRASFEDLITREDRKLDKAKIANLSTCEWIAKRQNLIVEGLTGTGKSWMGCAFGYLACRQGISALYSRTVDLLEEISKAYADGSLPKLKAKLVRPKVLMLDDFGIGEITHQAATVLFDIFDSRLRTGSLILTSQFTIDKWHALIPDPTVADAILDRIVHQSHKIHLEGPSLRGLLGLEP